ncbi:MAG TPA: polysaccharide pyruvyl transferase family protein [Devosia sp.]|nr:polysaccharide pyruvyl transferase family protein [Devosia sp.]
MRIAAICAFPADHNPGMVSVDVALHHFLSRYGIEADVQMFNFVKAVEIPSAGANYPSISQRRLTDPRELEDYDIILYWGDFLHSWRYLNYDVRVVTPEEQRSDPGFLDGAMAALLLEGAPESVLRKVICFGGSLYINRPQHDANARYHSAIARLYSNARLTLMRDPISAALAQNYGAKGQTLGVDAAFLLSKGSKPDLAGPVGYSFGRIRWFRPIRLRLQPFARRLAGVLGKDTTNIDWLNVDQEHPSRELADRIDLVRRCSVVVTDTYHCAITAWREGVPAICLGLGAEYRSSTLADKKKELMLGMFNAGAFYLYLEELRGLIGGGAQARRYADLVNDTSVVEAVGRNITLATERAERRLLEALTGRS